MAQALIDMTRLLPAPGPLWGPYPMRPGDQLAPAWRRPRPCTPLAYCRRVARQSLPHGREWLALEPHARTSVLGQLRTRLRREGLSGAAVAQALGIAAACAAEILGQTPRQTQLMAAAALLDNRFAEMATGEGKTLAIGLAAAVAALSGIPVHVVTANIYLARRDALLMAPVWAALGLQAAVPADADSEAERRAAYSRPIIYTTAKDLAFDYLRDRQLLAAATAPERTAARLASGDVGPEPLLRGLCMALLDEADSILLDEAEVPLILSRAAPHAARRAFLWQALAVARQLDAGHDFITQPQDRTVTLTPGGEQRLQQLSEALGGPWRRPRYRRDAAVMALAALHVYQRDIHYLVRDGAVELLDEVTGRVAQGRVWSRGLHTVVAIKEGLTPPEETETIAQTTFQRFFQRYWRICGISGTLVEARAELSAVVAAVVVRIPLHRRNRRTELPLRRFASMALLLDAVASRVATLQASGRPVLVGTDSVADSEQLSLRLHAAGVKHHVLNARNDAQEAAIVAQAGRAGTVTVATRLAGRGTDIEPDAAALAAGGLHVLSIQHNPSRRLDRQLAGRAGRHGDPGSHEHWLCDERAGGRLLATTLGLPLWNSLARSASAAWLLRASVTAAQRHEEHRRLLVRRALLEQDLSWERRLAFAGPAA